jgi:hypothetical protein
MYAVLSVVGGWLAKFLTVDVAKAAFEKAVLYALFTVVLPLVLWNLLHKILQFFIGRMEVAVGSGVPGMILEATGLLAWVFQQAYVPLCLSIIVSALMLRWTLNIVKLRP